MISITPSQFRQLISCFYFLILPILSINTVFSAILSPVPTEAQSLRFSKDYLRNSTELKTSTLKKAGETTEKLIRKQAQLRSQAPFVAGELVITFKEGVLPDEIKLKKITGLNDLKIKSQNNNTVLINSKQLERSSKKTENNNLALNFKIENQTLNIYNLLNNNSDILYVEPNYIYKLASTSADPFFQYQWHLNNTSQTGGKNDADIDAPEAWDLNQGSANVVVAVIDSGVDYTNPDLAENVILGYDFANNDSDPADDSGHGTHVAGIVAAKNENNYGGSGVCPNCKVLAVKVFDKSGNTSSFAISAGINYAVSSGAKVINLSLGGPGDSIFIKNAVQNAIAKNVTVVAASGNCGIWTAANCDFNGNGFRDSFETNFISYPAGYSGVISVAATDHNDNAFLYSNNGSTVKISAPGVRIASTLPLWTGYSYGYDTGTSMASPMVAAAAGLALSKNPNLSNSEVSDLVISSADKINLPSGFGSGRLNINNLLLKLNQAPTATNDNFEIIDGQTTKVLDILTNDSDPDGILNPQTINILTKPTFGDVLIDPQSGEVTFTTKGLVRVPSVDPDNIDFTYTVKDQQGLTSNVATVTIKFIPSPNQSPIANNDSAETSFGTSVAINVLSNDTDPDNDLLSIVDITKQGQNGIFYIQDNQILYLPMPGFVGEDAGEYKISDNKGGTAIGKVTIIVKPEVFQSPTAVDDTANTLENKAVEIEVLANDIDNDSNVLDSKITIETNGVNGVCEVVNQTIKYTPNLGYIGQDSCTYFITDKTNLNSNIATVKISIKALPITISNKAVKPVLEKIMDQGNGLYEAKFGYLNENNIEINIPVGNDNYFHPNSIDRGQTTNFKPGRQYGVYTINMSCGQTIVWLLKGPDNIRRSSTATTPACTTNTLVSQSIANTATNSNTAEN